MQSGDAAASGSDKPFGSDDFSMDNGFDDDDDDGWTSGHPALAMAGTCEVPEACRDSLPAGVPGASHAALARDRMSLLPDWQVNHVQTPMAVIASASEPLASAERRQSSLSQRISQMDAQAQPEGSDGLRGSIASPGPGVLAFQHYAMSARRLDSWHAPQML
jgi:hypothetical protein